MARCVRWSVLGTLPLVLFLVVAPFEVPARTHLLVALSAAVLIVNGARGGRWVYGFALFPLIWIEALYWSLPTTRAGDAEFWRVTDWHLLVTTASVVLGIQVPSAALRGSWSERLRPVVQPLHLWSMGCALLLVAGSFDHAFGGVPYNLPGLAVLAASVLAVAWSHRSGVFFVLGSWLAFLLCQGLPESPSELVQPWRLGSPRAERASSLVVGQGPAAHRSHPAGLDPGHLRRGRRAVGRADPRGQVVVVRGPRSARCDVLGSDRLVPGGTTRTTTLDRLRRHRTRDARQRPRRARLARGVAPWPRDLAGPDDRNGDGRDADRSVGCSC